MLHRIVYGLVLIFIAIIAITAGLLFYDQDRILVPKWRAVSGLLLLAGITVAVFSSKNSGVIRNGLIVSIPLLLVSVFLNVLVDQHHPFYRYAAVRHVNSDGFIESDEIYLRSAPVVQMLEKEGPRISDEGGSFGIERYLYSPRAGLILGKTLGEGNGDPQIGYELSGVSAWFFGVRAACEGFACHVINFTPAILAYVIICHYRKRPNTESLVVDPIKGLFLIGPFILGLSPIIGY